MREGRPQRQFRALDRDGNRMRIAVKDESMAVTKADGTEETVQLQRNADGSISAALADGTEIGISEDGSEVTTTQHGSGESVFLRDGGLEDMVFPVDGDREDHQPLREWKSPPHHGRPRGEF